MTFKEKYDSVEDWYKKSIVMNMYHTIMEQKIKDWTISDTAHYFGCSIGLVSENLKIAKSIETDKNHDLEKMKTRREALRYIEVRNG